MSFRNLVPQRQKGILSKKGIKAMFYAGDKVVYPVHGVASIDQIEHLDIGGGVVQVVVLHLQKDRMIIRIPFNKIKSLGIRPLSSADLFQQALDILTQAPKPAPKKIWIRRSQELTAKIQSGDLLVLASVIRDLGYKGDLTAQSFGEHQIFHQAVSRFIEEWCHIHPISSQEAEHALLQLLTSSSLLS